jgi:hypothetical protein
VLPNELRADQFNAYPPEARRLLVRELAILQQLPLSYLPLLLREMITYDWRFPAERKEIDDQFLYLGAMSRAQLAGTMAPFAAIALSPDLQQVDWVNDPVQFSEKFSAHLWATHQLDAFRRASIDFIHAVHASRPAETLPLPRLGLIMVGQQVQTTKYPLFRKLRPRGVHFTNVDPANGRESMFAAFLQRAKKHPAPYAHWYIDGGSAELPHPEITSVSYNALLPVRDALLSLMVRTMAAGSGPELLRTKLALMRPSDVGLPDNGDAGTLSRFQLSLLTEGSGTQIFSTTFVQWASREALRRAQPLTLLAHYAPRQRDSVIQPPSAETPATDPQASLIDADMAAYYTWINQQRLTGAEQAAFLVWFEGHNEAVAVGPKLPPGTTGSNIISLAAILDQLA